MRDVGSLDFSITMLLISMPSCTVLCLHLYVHHSDSRLKMLILMASKRCKLGKTLNTMPANISEFTVHEYALLRELS